MTSRPVRLWLALGLLASAGLTAQSPGPANSGPGTLGPTTRRPAIPNPTPIPVKNGDDMVDSFKIQDVDIDSVLSALEQYTGRTVVRPGTLTTAPYSIRFNHPVSKAELVVALETLLELNQIAVTPLGDHLLKVTALGQARSEAPEMLIGSSLDLPPSNRVATKLFELEFLRVSEFAPQIQGMLTTFIGGGVVMLERANALLVTDTVVNIQRIERLLKEVDQPRENSLVPKFYPVHNSTATALVTKIRALLSGPAQNQLRATTTYTPDDRTNQVIVIADPREYPIFDALIEHLDLRSDPNTSNEVIALKHADAKDVATLLGSLISGQNAATQKAAAQSVHAGQVTLPGQPATPPGLPVQPALNLPGGESLNVSGEFSTLITVTPDERTNSIVVSGTKDDVRLIHQVVDKIDILLAQVSIQVVIAEVTLTDSDQSGLSALALTISKATNGGTSITNITGTVAGASVASANTVANTTTGLIAGDLSPLSIIGTLQAAGDLHKVRILQTNTIVTTHAKQASFTVTQQLPVITGVTATPTAATTTSSGLTTSSSVTYKDIGITLKVTPLIGDDGHIQLTIDQIVDDNQGSVTIDGNSQPIIGHREANSFVNVSDGQMVALGGLQNSQRTYDRQKLGFLFEIPIISNLLGARSLEHDRTELFFFIRPHIMRPDKNTEETLDQIHGLSNHAHVEDYLKDPNRMPDDNESLKQKFK